VNFFPTTRGLWKPRLRAVRDLTSCVRRHIIAVTLAMIVVSTASPIIRAQANPRAEYDLKAAFLFNFAKFIDWPATSFTKPHSPFTICVLGRDPFGHALDDSLQGKMIRDQPLVVRRLNDKTETRGCQVLFVSSSESGHLADILEIVRGSNVLVVGETPGFAAAGGVIEFTLEDNRVRFTINTDAANRAGLTVSSKLLALAKVVHDGRPGKGG
jgi:uncharacterized protein DUF4154